MHATDKNPARKAMPAASMLAALLCGTATAGNASIDYAALEQLFGEAVTASATGSPQRESDVAATMVIITAEDIRRSGARDIPGVLRYVAGIDVLRTSNDHSDVSVRGYNQAFSPRLLVLVDGRQVYADYYGFTPWSTVPVELAAIRQIEIVKGPNSALFGFNAVGGVVNIVTYDPVRDDVDAVSVTGGTQSLVQSSLTTTWSLGESAGVRLTAGYRENDDYSTPLPPTEIGTRRGNERTAIGLNAGADIGDNVRVGLDASYSDARQAEFAPTYTMTYGEYQTGSIKGHVAADLPIGLLQATLYTNEVTTDAYIADMREPIVSFDNRVTVGRLEGISRLADGHTIRLSAEYRHNTMATTPYEGGDVFYDVAALGGMWEWSVHPAVTLTTAIRLDRWSLGRSGSVPDGYPLTNADWDRTETETSFNAAVVWHASDTDTVRLLAGRGVLLPNLLNLGGSLAAFPPFGFFGGIPDLRPTVVDNYELGWDRTLSVLPATLRASVFHGRSEDVVAIGGGVRLPDLFGLPVNIGDSDTTGVEVGMDGTFRDAWRWSVSYKYQDIDDDFAADIPVTFSYTDYQHTLPRHVAKASVGWQDGSWSADVYIRYRSATQGIRADPDFFGFGALVPLPARFTVDGRVGYAINEHLTLALSGENLTRPEQQQTSAPAVERAVFATLNFDFGGER